MRSSREIVTIFEAKGCLVDVRDLGHSYRAGGEILIYAPGVDPKDEDQGFAFLRAEFDAFDSTGYDGRGRQYSVWIVSDGDFVRVTEAEYANADEVNRISFGREHRSCGNIMYFAHRNEVEQKGLNDMKSAFATLGL